MQTTAQKTMKMEVLRMDKETRKLLNVREVADLLCLSENSIYQLIRRDNTFPCIRVGGSWRIPSDDLEAWLEARKRK